MEDGRIPADKSASIPTEPEADGRANPAQTVDDILGWWDAEPEMPGWFDDDYEPSN